MNKQSLLMSLGTRFPNFLRKIWYLDESFFQNFPKFVPNGTNFSFLKFVKRFEVCMHFLILVMLIWLEMLVKINQILVRGVKKGFFFFFCERGDSKSFHFVKEG